MNRPLQGFSNNKVDNLNSPSKATTLNPNAAEFIPATHRSISRNTNSADVTGLDFPGALAKPVLDRSESSVSGNSDDEAHQYLCSQLPDDITPDFKVMGENELRAPEQLSLADLSINNGVETSRFATSAFKQLLDKHHNIYSHGNGNLGLTEKTGVSSSTYAEDQTSAFMDLTSNNRYKWLINGDKAVPLRREGHHYGGDSGLAFLDDSQKKDTFIKHLDLLASQFPGFPVESLAKLYCENGYDINLTIDILTEHQLQNSGNLHQNLKSKGLVMPGVGVLDFTAIPAADAQNGLSRYEEADFQRACNTYKTPTRISRGVIGNSTAVRELTVQDAGPWMYERIGSTGGISSSSRSSHLLASPYGGHQKPVSGNKLQNLDMIFAASVWPESGRTLANVSLETREEAHDFAPLRNMCFEQAKEAYLLGDKARAKELSAKGQLLDMHMKAGHQKAVETSYRQRNLASHELRGYGHSQVHPIDLRGLHATEAIRFLQDEVRSLRGAAKLAGQRLLAMISVGTGHQTRGLGTPGRLATAVRQYLLEEGLQYVQLQPGQFNVVIH